MNVCINICLLAKADSIEYVESFLETGKIRRPISLYGASLLFAKTKVNMKCLVDYVALNKITKGNNASLSRSDEIRHHTVSVKLCLESDLMIEFQYM